MPALACPLALAVTTLLAVVPGAEGPMPRPKPKPVVVTPARADRHRPCPEARASDETVPVRARQVGRS